MTVSCGIVGLPNVGKSTIFNALTAAAAEQANYPFCTIEPNIAIVDVPDTNLHEIHSRISTQKVIPASLRVVDIAGLIAGASKGEGMGNQFLATIRECDAIMQVVRCFTTPSVVREGAVDPVADIEIVELELILADLDTVTRARERVKKKTRSGDKDAIVELGIMDRAKEVLENDRLLRTEKWTAQERAVLRPLCLMTIKKMLYVANVGDDDLEGKSVHAQEVAKKALESDAEWLPICGDLECELRTMDAEDREMFMIDLGIKALGLERLIQHTYKLLELQTFYTAGEKEVRAWTVRKGWEAPKGASVIHTDFEKKFIRAEIYSVQDLIEHESETAIKSAGKLRTEGRSYVMQEGDICHFLIGP